MKKIFKLIFSILICQLAGFLGSLATTPAIPDWYAKLNKPSFNPPNWIFAPVWTTLFLLMGIALFLILNQKKNKKAKTIFFIQLILNTLWSFLFFGLHSPLLAFLEIIILWTAILLTMIQFYKLQKWAGILLLPYLLWVSFAAILNFSIWRIN
jgi:benzodiazapine receptor